MRQQRSFDPPEPQPHRSSGSSRLCLIITFASVVTLSSQGLLGVPPDLVEQLTRAEAIWAASKPGAYEFTFAHACNGTIPLTPPGWPTRWLIQVKGEESTLPRFVVGDARETLEAYGTTVEKQFAFIRKAWAARPVGMEVQYDPRYGYPTRVCVDPTALTDDQFGFTVGDFTITSKVGSVLPRPESLLRASRR
jgi:hypothetical protein